MVMIYFIVLVIIFLFWPPFTIAYLLHDYPVVSYIIMAFAAIGETFFLKDLFDEFTRKDDDNFMI